MECRFSMTALRGCLVCLVCIVLHAGNVAAEHEVVLVVAATSPLNELGSLELRKIYLGFPVRREGEIIKGLRNTTDKSIDRIFLQTVVAMSERSYVRRLLTLTMQRGTPRPREYQNLADLQAALVSDPNSISYIWQEDAVRMPDVKILKVLWQEY
jgi:hypothetical protein